MLFEGVLLLFSFLQPLLSPAVPTESGFLSWIHIHRCFRSSKALNKYLLSETWLIFFGTVFLHLAVHLKNKTKQNKTCNQGCLLSGKV